MAQGEILRAGLPAGRMLFAALLAGRMVLAGSGEPFVQPPGTGGTEFTDYAPITNHSETPPGGYWCYATGAGRPDSVTVALDVRDCDEATYFPLEGGEGAPGTTVQFSEPVAILESGCTGGTVTMTSSQSFVFQAATPGSYGVWMVIDDGGDGIVGYDDVALNLDVTINVLGAGEDPPGGDPPPGGGRPPQPNPPPGGWDPVPPPWEGRHITAPAREEPGWGFGPGIDAEVTRNMILCLETVESCDPRPATGTMQLHARDLDSWLCGEQAGLAGDVVLFNLESVSAGGSVTMTDGLAVFSAGQPGDYEVVFRVDDGGGKDRDDLPVLLRVTFKVRARCGRPRPPGLPPLPPPPWQDPIGGDPPIGWSPTPDPPPPPCSSYRWRPHTGIDAEVTPTRQTIYVQDGGLDTDAAEFTVDGADVDLQGCPNAPDTDQEKGDEMFASWSVVDGPAGWSDGDNCWTDQSLYGNKGWFRATRPGRYTLEVVVDDFAKTGPEDEGSRDDPAVTLEVTVDVIRPTVQLAAESLDVCVGAVPSPVHQTRLTATVTGIGGAPLPGVKVDFFHTHDWHVTMAQLSPVSATTDANGQAATILTAGDLVVPGLVEACVDGRRRGSVAIGFGRPHAEWIFPDGFDGLLQPEVPVRITIRNTFGGQPVDAHHVTWWIRYWDHEPTGPGDEPSYEGPGDRWFGYFLQPFGVTDANGDVSTTFIGPWCYGWFDFVCQGHEGFLLPGTPQGD